MIKSYCLAVVLLFAIACSDDDKSGDTAAPITTVTPGVTITNVSDVSTADIKSWTDAMSAKMASQTSNVLAVSWNVGGQVSEGGFNRPFNTHQVIISDSNVELLMGEITNWLDTTCIANESKTEELSNFRNYIENGADASAQLVMCNNYRIVLMAFPSTMTSTDRQGLVIHEVYHAFQHDLADEDCSAQRDSSINGNWIVEGATEYFTMIEMYGTSQGVNKVLEKAYAAYNDDSDTAITGSDIASRGAAGIRYMIEQGSVNESEILDASFFHNCKSELEYTDANQNVTNAKANWYKIKSVNGVYSFI